MNSYQNFINGRFTPSSGVDQIEVFNPSTGQAICTVPDSSQADVDAAVAAEKYEDAAQLRDQIQRLGNPVKPISSRSSFFNVSELPQAYAPLIRL